MRTIQIQAEEFATADEAIQHTFASGRGYVIHVGGKYLVAERQEIDRVERMGVPFAYIFLHDLPDGRERVVSVPVNWDRDDNT